MKYCLLLSLLLSSLNSAFASEIKKHVLGPQGYIDVLEANMPVWAQFNTGQKHSTLYVDEFAVVGGSQIDPSLYPASRQASWVLPQMELNIGRNLEFVLRSENGQVKLMRSIIQGVVLSPAAQGLRASYVIDLNLGHKKSTREVQVHVQKKDQQAYSLDVGRAWLHGRYVVDVEKAIAKR